MSSDMEAVNAFNAELSSLYDVKPPISKGKMTSITRAALKAVKLYKHVVQSVEKFIQKCKPEYKIPGLYVIDSIIRQSRHQFGAEKDVFATRFSRNLTNTFMHLYKCPDEDKAKIIRVLNLWQKNKIFMPDVIAPLFDLANPNHAIWETISSQQQTSAESNNNSANKSSAADANQVHFKKELLDYDYDDDVDPSDKDKGMQQHSTGSSQGLAEKIPPNVLSGFDALGSLLANPEVLRQLQTLQEQMAAAAAQQSQLSQFSTPEQERQRKLAELNKQEAAFEQRLAQTVARLPFAVECEFDPTSKGPGDQAREEKPDNNVMIQQQLQAQQSAAGMAQLLPPAFFQQLENNPNLASVPPPPLPTIFDQQGNFGQFGQQLQQQQQQQQMHQQQELISQGMFSHFNNFGVPPPQQQQTQLQQQPPTAFDEKEREQRNRRRRSRSPATAERRKSRSRSRSRSRRRSRSGSRGRVGRRRYTRSRSRERREEREREKERARKGFPTMRKEHLSVCSTTLWVGHLSRLVSQEEISDTFGAYGDIISIDLIAPRGCAFVVMNRRQDALRALDRLKNVKLQGKAITLAWAPGKSVKGREWKDYWEVEHGVSYIPWTKLKADTNIDEFEDGGCVDEDTLPPYLKDRPKAAPEQSGAEMKGDISQDGGKGQSATMTPTTNTGVPAPLLPTPSSVQVLMDGQQQQHQTPVSGGDTDVRVELNAVAAAVHATGQPLGPTGPPGMVQPFMGLPPQVGLMGMGPQFGMMVPPPILGGPGGPGPGLQPFGPPPSLLSVMGQAPPGMMGPGGPMGTPTGPGAGLLGDMPMVHPVLQSSINSNVDMASGPFGSDSEIKRMRSQDDDATRPTGDVQKRKKSRFEDIPVDEKSSDGLSRKDERVPLHERLKNIAEYGMDGRQSLLGAPRAAAMGNTLMFNNGQATPMGPDGGSGGGGGGFIRPLFASPTAGPGNPALPPGPPAPGAWGFDTGNDNPFLNPNNPNPFIGNPFMQQQGPAGGNPFDLSSSFEDFNSPRGRGGWMGGRDAQQQSPQKWGGRGGDRGGNWGRGDRRPDDRFDDSWRSGGGGGGGGGGREGRGHRDSRSGDRSDHRDRDYRGGDRGSGGGRDWKDREGGRRGRFDRDGPPRRSRHDSEENVSANGGGNDDSERPRRNRSREDEKPKGGESNDKSESWEEDQKSGKENEWNEAAEGLNEDWNENVSREEKNNAEEDWDENVSREEKNNTEEAWDENVSREEKNNTEEEDQEEQHHEEESSSVVPPPNDSEQRLEGPEDDGDPDDEASSNQREPEPSSEYQDNEDYEEATNVSNSSNNNNNNHNNDHHIVEENNDWTNSDSVNNDDEPEEASVQNCWNSSVNNYSDSANSNSVVQEADERQEDDYVGNGGESGEEEEEVEENHNSEEAQELCEDVRNYDEGNSHVVNDHSPLPPPPMITAAAVKQCEPSTPLDSSCLLLSSSTGTNNVQCNDESNNSHENELIETDGDAV